MFRRRERRRAVGELYGRIVGAARRPDFYARYGVPDSLDGRFEMVTLHMYFVLRRLKAGGREEAELAQDLFDYMFADMDSTLREMGVGDMGVGKKVKFMAQAFMGRIAAYDRGLREGDAELAQALSRNLYGTLDEVDDVAVAAMARFVREEMARFDRIEPAALRDADLFPETELEVAQ